MSDREIKAIYLALKESGDLLKLFPDMTGKWERDGARFTKEYNKNEIMLDDIEICDSEEDTEFF